MNGNIHSIETFGTVDGPGIRFVVFLQGCRWRCRYCHNPDTWRTDGGTATTAHDLLRQALRYQAWFSSSGGGVTVSGGEPLLQAAFTAEFFEHCKAQGVHTCLDTAGDLSALEEEKEGDETLDRLLRGTDLVLLDIKHSNPLAHQALTGFLPDSALRFAHTLAIRGIPTILRHVVVPGWTDDEDHIRNLVRYANSFPNVREIQWLPYHRLGTYKWKASGIPYTLEDTPAADEALMERVREWEKAVRADCQPPTHPI